MILRNSVVCYSEVSGFDLELSTLGRQKTEGRKQKAESRRQKAEGRRQKAEAFSAFCFLPSAFCLLLSAFCFLPSAFFSCLIRKQCIVQDLPRDSFSIVPPAHLSTAVSSLVVDPGYTSDDYHGLRSVAN